MTASERISKLIHDASDLALVSIFIVICVVLWLPGVQNRAAFGLAAFGLGVGLGLCARWAAFIPDGVEILATMLGVICGPITVAWAQGKTVFEVLEEIRRARKGTGDE